MKYIATYLWIFVTLLVLIISVELVTAEPKGYRVFTEYHAGEVYLIVISDQGGVGICKK